MMGHVLATASAHAHSLGMHIAVSRGSADSPEVIVITPLADSYAGAKAGSVIIEELDATTIPTGHEVATRPAFKWPDGLGEAYGIAESQESLVQYDEKPKKKPEPYFGPPKKKSRHDRRKH